MNSIPDLPFWRMTLAFSVILFFLQLQSPGADGLALFIGSPIVAGLASGALCGMIAFFSRSTKPPRSGPPPARHA